MDPLQTPPDHYAGLRRHECVEVADNQECEDQSQVCNRYTPIMQSYTITLDCSKKVNVLNQALQSSLNC